MSLTPQQFIQKWGPGGTAFALNEEQGAQSHFLDLCELLEVPKPGSAEGYRFEERSSLIGGKTGYCDVFLQGTFAWENKAPGKNLDAALKQLLNYSLVLSNPPLLIVCDRMTTRIHTQFTGHPTEVHTVLLAELDQPDKLALLRRVWQNPESFRPKKTSRDITEAAARSFALLAEGLRRRNAKADDSPQTVETRANQVAHFLTQCLFCFFAEDVGLLPGRMFERLVVNKRLTSERLNEGLRDLFQAMKNGGMFGADDIPWFNGGLFGVVNVPILSIMDVTELRNAAELNWSAIDVSIFGTLFERGLDPAKRSQLGAHYTDPATIMRIVSPVIERPLLQLWDETRLQIESLLAASKKSARAAVKLPGQRKVDASPGDKNYQAAKIKFQDWLNALAAYRILDPACGSGNFLFLGLKTLKDVEHRSHLDAHAMGLEREADLVTGPHNMLGIELNEYAAELARVTVWIGELQWRMAHGYEFKTNPVLEPLDHIECRDALLSFAVADSQVAGSQAVGSQGVSSQAVGSQARAGQMLKPHTPSFLKSAQPSAPPAPGIGELNSAVVDKSARAVALEATWPKASVVVGNPPFLGVSRKRSELGEDYTQALTSVYSPTVPGGADLVCYWFAKALAAIETNGLGAAGLVATNSIRGGANRKVLQAITGQSRIYAAWSDEAWVNDGAAVRVSLVCFGHGSGSALNGKNVPEIYSDLTAPTLAGDLLDVSQAHTLGTNLQASFQGASKKAKFEIDEKLARTWLRQPNPHGRPSSEVLKPWVNGFELSRGPQRQWIIDFGNGMSEMEAAMFEQPFAHVLSYVKPNRIVSPDTALRDFWWRFGRPRVEMRRALKPLERFIATVAHSKHRFFVWLPVTTSPDQALITVARADDTTFGILHSRFHELWSLRTGTSLEDRPRYTPTTCFETFPFPVGLTPADTALQQTETLTTGAQIPAGLEPSSLPTQSQNKPNSKAGVGRTMGAISKSEAYEPPAFAPLPPGQSAAASTIGKQVQPDIRQLAIQIANAAKTLNDLRNNWLNPPEWTHRVPEVVPLGMTASPYPDRIEPKPGISETDMKALQKRTLTNLYNLRPQWLAHAHEQLDQAVAAAYRWPDYSATMPDDEILKRLLALNLERADPKDIKQ